MDIRQQKGLEIAATMKLQRAGTKWLVPSQSGKGKYAVDVSGVCPSCTCPDFEQRDERCKHIFAVQYVLQREADGVMGEPGAGEAIVTETLTVRETVQVTYENQVTYEKKYKQNWPAYNAAQTHEKARFLVLLCDLCRGVPDPIQTFGRPRLPFGDMVFCAVFKVYATISSRRLISDLEDAHTKGYVSKVPHYNSLINYFEMKELTPIIRELITQSSLPLKSIETDFAVDSSGFGTSRFVKWYNVRYGQVQDNHDWIKMHLMCGVKTNIVTSVEISGRYSHDAPMLQPLVDSTARNFALSEVSADKAYSSRQNLTAIATHGAMPLIPFKSNSTGMGTPTGKGEGCELWSKMWHYYSYNRSGFLAHYHKRSNIESTFSMIKAKFGDAVRSKTDTAQVNEALCKVLCHNICVVIQSIYELGIEPTFWAE